MLPHDRPPMETDRNHEGAEAGTTARRRSSQHDGDLRVAVSNLQVGIGTTRGYWQYLFTGWKYLLPHGSGPIHRAAAFLDEEAIDLGLFCEVGGGARRTRGLDQATILTRESRLAHHVFFPTFVVSDRINQGNAVCSRFHLQEGKSHQLPGPGEPRFLNHVTVRLGDQHTHVYVTHLSLEHEVRAPQLRRIEEVVTRHDAPTLLAGDFNVSAEAELELLETAGLQRAAAAPTFPSWNPKKSLDQLFFSPHFEIVDCRIFDRFRFSDHLPLVVELRLRSGPAR